MWGNRIALYLRGLFAGRIWQSLAILFCVLFGVAMIANNQLQGEAWWFWYARLLHSGTKLYADMHLPLQPLYALETDAWIQLFGIKVLATESLSVVYVAVFCLGIFLVLRESDWPDWQKAIVLASAFLISVECSAYRFDDYHIATDTFTLYSVVVLLLLAKAEAPRRQFALATVLGILTGAAITTRVTDGLALLAAAAACVLVLARGRKFLLASLFVVVAAATVVLVVKLTGDTFSDYATNSIFKAATAKGGAGSIATAPFRIVGDAIHAIRGRKWLLCWIAGIGAASALVQRFWKNQFRYMVLLQLGMAGFVYVVSSELHRTELRSEGLFFFLTTRILFLVNYLLFPIAAIRYLRSKLGRGQREWDSRETLILVPLAGLASTSASTAATVTQLFWWPIALLLLLYPVIQPLRRQASWANAMLVTIMALMGLNVLGEKIPYPYSWVHFYSLPMFRGREWYRHPVYGPMYMEKRQLDFILPICREIDAGGPKPELLSMPWSYPNFFCDTPPWHGYVQTFYDTSTRSTIDELMHELDTAPPQWIIYERNMHDLNSVEQALTGGHPPLPHRYLDQLIMRKIAAGQWHVVEKSDYLFDYKDDVRNGNGWYIIQTRP